MKQTTTNELEKREETNKQIKNADTDAVETAEKKNSDLEEYEGDQQQIDLAKITKEIKQLYDPYWKEEAKKAFAARDELKEKLKELQSTIDDRIAEAIAKEQAKFERINKLNQQGCVDAALAEPLILELLQSGMEEDEAIEELKRKKPHLFANKQQTAYRPFSVRSSASRLSVSNKTIRQLAATRYKV